MIAYHSCVTNEILIVLDRMKNLINVNTRELRRTFLGWGWNIFETGRRRPAGKPHLCPTTHQEKCGVRNFCIDHRVLHPAFKKPSANRPAISLLITLTPRNKCSLTSNQKRAFIPFLTLRASTVAPAAVEVTEFRTSRNLTSSTASEFDT